MRSFRQISGARAHAINELAQSSCSLLTTHANWSQDPPCWRGANSSFHPRFAGGPGRRCSSALEDAARAPAPCACDSAAAVHVRARLHRPRCARDGWRVDAGGGGLHRGLVRCGGVDGHGRRSAREERALQGDLAQRAGRVGREVPAPPARGAGHQARLAHLPIQGALVPATRQCSLRTRATAPSLHQPRDACTDSSPLHRSAQAAAPVHLPLLALHLRLPTPSSPHTLPRRARPRRTWSRSSSTGRWR